MRDDRDETEQREPGMAERESGEPGGGRGRRDEAGSIGAHPVSAGPTPGHEAERS